MTKILGPLLLVLFAANAWSQVFDTAFSYALNQKCQNELPLFKKKCASLSKETTKHLDIAYDLENVGLAFFSGELVSLLNDKKIQTTIAQLRKSIELGQYDLVYRFDLYAELESEYGAEETDRLLAVLFQDNIAKYHIQWLRITKKAPTKVINDLDKLLSLVGNKKAQKSAVMVYPKSLSESTLDSFNEKPYYYYLPLKISRHLNQKFTAQDVVAFTTYLSLIYKYHHHYQSFFQAYFKKPLPIKEDSSSWEYRFRDLFMSYMGAQKGTSIDQKNSFASFRTQIKNNPLQAVQDLSRRKK